MCRKLFYQEDSWVVLKLRSPAWLSPLSNRNLRHVVSASHPSRYVSFVFVTNRLSAIVSSLSPITSKAPLEYAKELNILTNQSLCAPMEERPLGRDLSLTFRSGQNLAIASDWAPLVKNAVVKVYKYERNKPSNTLYFFTHQLTL